MNEKDVSILCRLCLNKSYFFSNIYATHISENIPCYEDINYVYDLQISLADGLPEYICQKCLETVKEFKIHKANAHRVNSHLIQLTQHMNDAFNTEAVAHPFKRENSFGDQVNEIPITIKEEPITFDEPTANSEMMSVDCEDYIEPQVHIKEEVDEEKESSDQDALSEEEIRLETEKAEMREEFDKDLESIVSTKSKNNLYMDEDSYGQIIKEVEGAKLKRKYKTPLEYRRLERYDVVTVGKEKRLISPLGKGSEAGNIKYFVSTGEVFDVIHDAHLSIAHGGRNRLVKELSKKYKNVTVEAIRLYLSLCKVCQRKPRRKKKSAAIVGD